MPVGSIVAFGSRCAAAFRVTNPLDAIVTHGAHRCRVPRVILPPVLQRHSDTRQGSSDGTELAYGDDARDHAMCDGLLTMSVVRSVGPRLRTARKAVRLSQLAVGKFVGVSRQAVSQAESG